MAAERSACVILSQCVCVCLTGGAVYSVAARFAVLTGGAMETLVAAALPVAVVTVLALAVIGAGAAIVSGAFEALVAVETGAAGVILRGGERRPFPRLRTVKVVF